jgi:hypothetical protein
VLKNSLPRKSSKNFAIERSTNTISVLAGIFSLTNSGYFDKTGVFQQTQAIALTETGPIFGPGFKTRVIDAIS